MPLARQPFYADVTKISTVKNIDPADLTALRAGQIVEVVEVLPAVISAPLADVKQAARTRLIALQQLFNRDNTFNRYGTRWTQASGWVDVVVA